MFSISACARSMMNWFTQAMAWDLWGGVGVTWAPPEIPVPLKPTLKHTWAPPETPELLKPTLKPTWALPKTPEPPEPTLKPTWTPQNSP